MTMKIAVLLTNLVQDDELREPIKNFENKNQNVTLIDTNVHEITGVMGSKFQINNKVSEVDPAKYDALFLPGGFSPDQLRTDSKVIKFVKHFLLNNKWIFAICHGPQFFIQSGLINGRTITGYQSIIPDLYFAGAIVKDEPVVIDLNIITSRNPDDLPIFIETINTQLNI